MISAQNRLPLLSGNKWLLFLWMALLAVSCSPKIKPAAPPVKPQTETPPPKIEPPAPVKVIPKRSVISLILPFGLNFLNGSNYTSNSLMQANLAADYYQGFKLALDSLTAAGYNYKLQVFDSEGSEAQAHSLAYNPQIRASDLIVGPVFPDDMKAFISVLTSTRGPILSPLSPSSPLTFKNQNLITAIPPLEYHAHAAAKYLVKVKPQKIFILKSGYSEENEYFIPFKKAIDSLSKRSIRVVQLTVTRGQLNSLLPQLSTKTPNIFVMASTNQAFLMVTLRSLDSLAKKYPVTLFGHPSWDKFNFLHADVLQRLKTHITSADKVDYKSPATISFLRNYRRDYHVEPTDFAIKGFDEGLYFGQLLGAGGLKNLDQSDYTGLHNGFHFIKRPGLGWINTHINILQYTNFELKKIE
jgi:ABC-type branched-subunit amino acid transport system substrate-binding protein